MAFARIGQEIQIPGHMPHTEYEVTGSSVAALPGGGWIVVWAEDVIGRTEIYAQQFGATGIALAPPERINQTALLSESVHPVVTALSDGSWVATWADVGDGDDTIYQGHFAGVSPPWLSLGGGRIAEGADSGKTVGDLSLANVAANQTGTLQYQLLDDAGGRFVIEGTQLKVRDGLKLDHEQAKSHAILVKVIGSNGFAHTQTLTVSVDDVLREKLIGNDGAHYLQGGADIDIFSGMGGNDTLGGGAGKDTLTGGMGKDAFLFNTKPNKKTNVDTITDFRSKDDDIWLDDAIFKGLGKAGTMESPKKMAAKAFYTGPQAHDADDRIIFDKSKGVLYYDPDGIGPKVQVAIAKLPKKAMVAADFFVL
ncbi:hypothetical protein AB4072_09665 [Microvirga sp. 2MCAF38]|uniref:hypothetical protein n=1 Tax=Microvirga sp. 2MCAF38 TaxID=3232989 RepID=UPI003F9CAAB0